MPAHEVPRRSTDGGQAKVIYAGANRARAENSVIGRPEYEAGAWGSSYSRPVPPRPWKTRDTSAERLWSTIGWALRLELIAFSQRAILGSAAYASALAVAAKVTHPCSLASGAAAQQNMKPQPKLAPVHRSFRLVAVKCPLSMETRERL